ncbi:MAG: SAM-dependent methyltransferase, partial [Candidatus Binatia bacterium]
MAKTTPTIDEFLGKLVGDLGAVLSAALIGIGDALGLYKALAGTGGLAPGELAKRTGTDERYVREWLCAQAAAGYVDYDAAGGTFSLNEVQTLAFADDSSPAHFLGGFQVARSMFTDAPKILEAFRTGKG